jgi:YidC/Oxa1 family membrane protein insertase
MFDFLAKLLAYCYQLWPSYGGAIALLTLGIMLVLTPLSIKSTRSMIKMQRLQPELKRLQAQYKGDREGLNREMMAFYQANNVNPFSSCLPMLLQMPVFFVLYRILHGLTQTDGHGHFAPAYLDKTSSLYRALAGATQMKSFGIDLAKSSLTAMKDSGFGTALPYFLMVGVVVLTTWYQQRQIQGRNPAAAAANPQQQMMGRIVPFIMVPITISIPAGVVIYFVVSNIVRVGQQAVISYLEFGEGGSQATIIKPTPSSPPSKPAAGGKTTPTRTTPSGSAAARNQSNKKRKRK